MGVLEGGGLFLNGVEPLRSACAVEVGGVGAVSGQQQRAARQPQASVQANGERSQVVRCACKTVDHEAGSRPRLPLQRERLPERWPVRDIL